MKILYLILFLFSTPAAIYAQQVINVQIKPITRETGTKRPDSVSEIKNKPDTSKGTEVSYDCSTIDQIKNLSVKKNNDGSYNFALINSRSNPISSFTVNQFNLELYRDKISQAINKICNDSNSTKRNEILTQLLSQATYSSILEASLTVPDIDVIAGTLNVNKYVDFHTEEAAAATPAPSSKNGGSSNKLPANTSGEKLIVYSTQVQFQDGFIENIIVRGKISTNNTLLKFENAYPIAFSTKKNFQRLKRICLYEKSVFIKANHYIYLGDLLNFDPNLALYSKDYFPDNQIYKLDVTDSITTINLKKEKTSKILAVQVFSDLKGTDSNSPNGLIQVDFSKKLNLLTQRGRFLGSNSTNYGLINYFTPQFTLSKIENNRKNLILDYSGSDPNDPAKPNAYAMTKDLLLYQQYKIGGKLNIFLLDIPALKSTFFINGGFYYGRTPVQDTLRSLNVTTKLFTPIATNNLVEYGVNSFQMVPEIQWDIYPDERYGFSFTQQFNRYKLLNTKFKQIDNSERYTQFLTSMPADPKLYNFSQWMGSTEILGFFKPSDNNQIFLRYRFNWDMNNVKNNFNQIQVGITTYLSVAKAETKSK